MNELSQPIDLTGNNTYGHHTILSAERQPPVLPKLMPINRVPKGA
jgi:hypothetical protein